MKAIVYTQYGSPDLLALKEVEKPVPADGEVLVKVYAASLNSWDLDLLKGTFFIRLMAARPQYKILGADLAGRIEAVGKAVTRFRVGDEVFGDLSAFGWSAFAEYVCAPENALALKPTAMTFEQAASIPQAAGLALQGLHAAGKIQPGQKVLINGAGGGMGTFAVQIAKLYGAEVTGVDSAAKLDMLCAIGADHVLDYAREDFTKTGQRYDLILDAVAHRSISACKRALNPGGTYVTVGGSVLAVLQAMILAKQARNSTNRHIALLIWQPATDDLETMKALFQAGKVKPILDTSYPLENAAEAFRYLGSGQAKGKVIITM